MRILAIIALLQLGLAYADTELNSKNYFRLLDYDQASINNEIIEFDAKLIDVSQNIVHNLTKRGKLKSPNPKLGMVLVYAGMFIVNTNNGIMYKKIDLEKVANVTDPKGEDKLIARQAFAAELLHIARNLAPDDARIVAWESSAQFRIDILQHGGPSPDTVNWVMDLVKEDPIFNLFNGLVLNNSYPFALKDLEAMVAQAQVMTGIGSPCIPINPANWFSGDFKRCKTTSKTPFAYHGVMILMGDAYMKLAQRYLDDNNRTNNQLAHDYISKARRLYAKLNPNYVDPNREGWRIKQILGQRTRLADSALKAYDSLAITKYFNSSDGAKIYQCHSCHQGGRGEEVFNFLDIVKNKSK